MFPQQLYRLTQKDIESFSLIVPYFNTKRDDVGAGPGNITSTLSLDSVGDRFLVLCTLMVNANGLGVDLLNRVEIGVQSPPQDATQQSFVLSGGYYAGATASAYVNWVGEVLVPPRWRLYGYSEMAAALTGGSCRLFASGYLIPRGSISRL